MKIKDHIIKRKAEVEELIEDTIEDFLEDTDLCIFKVKVYWRETESGTPYPDVEIVASSEFHITPKQ